MFEGVDLRHAKRCHKSVSDLRLLHVRVLNYRKEFFKNNAASTIHLHQKRPLETCQNLDKISDFL